MKNAFSLSRGLLILLLPIALTACATAAEREQETKERQSTSAGEYIDDSLITAKVKAAFAEDETVKAYEVSVKTFKGVVQLSGFVDSREAVNRAGEIAGKVEGVTSVQNDLIVK
jgi:osmotically-inducible protein OsmY